MGIKGKKSLRGQGELYDEVKSRVNMTLTSTASNLLKKKAKSQGRSVSEMIESFARSDHESNLLEQNLPPPLADRLKQMPDRAQYVAEAIALFMQLSGETIAKLDSVGDRARGIENAIALLEEKGLLDEWENRMSN